MRVPFCKIINHETEECVWAIELLNEEQTQAARANGHVIRTIGHDHFVVLDGDQATKVSDLYRERGGPEYVTFTDYLVVLAA